MKYSKGIDRVCYCFGLSVASNLISSGVKTIHAEAFNKWLMVHTEPNKPSGRMKP